MSNPFANSVKFFKAITLLAMPQGTRIKDLMESLDISRRSVFRLLQALEELGFPITDEQPRSRTEKIYRLAEDYVLKLPNISILNPNLTEEEIDFMIEILETWSQSLLINESSRAKLIKEKLTAMKNNNTKENNV
jgi:predicted DNA-binding transcriptional regulator YafY